jgi:hypothetical protein
MLFHCLQLILVSDSPSSQYRNRYTIFLIADLCTLLGIPDMEWLYTEAGHGKGAPDGVGATIKRTADEHLARGGMIRNSAELITLMSNSIIMTKEVSTSPQNVI